MANRNGWTLALAWTLGVLINIFTWPFAQMLMFGMTEDTPVTAGTIGAGVIALIVANVPFLLLLVVLGDRNATWRLIGWGLTGAYVLALIGFGFRRVGFGLIFVLISLSSFAIALRWARSKEG